MMVAEFVMSINYLVDCPLIFAEISPCDFEGKNGEITLDFPLGALSLSTHFNFFPSFLTSTI